MCFQYRILGFDEMVQGDLVRELKDQKHHISLDLDTKKKNIQELCLTIDNLSRQIAEHQSLDQRNNVELDSKDREIESKNEELESKDREIESKNEELESKDREIESKNEELESKDREIESKNEELESKDKEIESKKEELESKDKEIESKKRRT